MNKDTHAQIGVKRTSVSVVFELLELHITCFYFRLEDILVILSVPFTSKTSFCSYENAEMLMLAPANTTTTVDEIIQMMRLARVTLGVLVPKRELGYPVKCLSTVVVHVEPSVSDLEKKTSCMRK